MRLDKFICKSTQLTRSEATALLHSGIVLVNGEVIKNEAAQVHENNRVTLNGEVLTARASRYIMMHKPADTICSNVDEIYPSVFNYLDVEKAQELHIVGRLDADTTGLILVTDDGRWSYNIITPKKQCAKVYRVQLRDNVSGDIISRFFRGVLLQGEGSLTLPAILDVISPKEVLLTITEGRFHQVKRMFAAVGNRVVALHREQIGDVRLDIEMGQWRYLTAAEVQSF
ncbi:pseudouridine synthase [Neptunomonas qingdaonensis]|uniref:Pseudouridine synthase n=1 Tax=Neptunomonas qingdaonensis TaxID=1045558 RepID=A0A1I2S7J9_9GAMM|nr:pseudouridine synthase [Neptunomonas qingdaonensis]SFG48812.1 16S rRNA pseudouridine516 synthase [Neptunomonas qingdaonensis]